MDLFNKPVFELKLESFAVSHFIRVNGKTVFIEFDSFGQTATTIPLNLWMKSGINTFGIEVLPDEEGEEFNPSSYILATIFVKENGIGQSERVFSLEFKGGGVKSGNAMESSTPAGVYSSSKKFGADDGGDIILSNIREIDIVDYKGAKSYGRDINIPSSLPLWAFFQSEDLPNYDEMPDDQYFPALDDLFIEYKKIQDALSIGDVDSIVAMANERNKETDLAFYLEPGTTQKKLKASLKDAIQDDNLVLAELIPDYVSIRVEDNRKLVRLIRGGETTAVGFNFKSFKGSQSYDFIFRRENGKWIVTR